METERIKSTLTEQELKDLHTITLLDRLYSLTMMMLMVPVAATIFLLGMVL